MEEHAGGGEERWGGPTVRGGELTFHRSGRGGWGRGGENPGAKHHRRSPGGGEMLLEMAWEGSK